MDVAEMAVVTSERVRSLTLARHLYDHICDPALEAKRREQFGTHLRTLRRGLDIGLRELARRIDADAANLSAIERGDLRSKAVAKRALDALADEHDRRSGLADDTPVGQ